MNSEEKLQWTLVLFFSVAMAIGAAVVFSGRALPFTDLPQHAWTIAVLRDPAAFGEHVMVSLRPWGTNAFWFAFMDPILSVFGVSPQGSVVFGSWLAVALTPAALAAWSRAHRGDAPAAVLFGWVVVWSMPLFRGYLHYALAMSVGVGALALGQRLSERLNGWSAALAITLLVVFSMHAQVFGFVLLALGIQWATSGRQATRSLALSALPALGLFARWGAQNFLRPLEGAAPLGSLQAGFGARFKPVVSAWMRLPESAQGIIADARWDDALAWAIVVFGVGSGAAALWRARGGKTVTNGALPALIIAALALGLYLFLPLHIEGQFFISARMAPWIGLALAPAVTVAIAPRWQRVRLGALMLVAAMVSATYLRNIIRFDAEAAPLARILERVPDEQRVMLWAPNRHATNLITKPFTHYPAWYAAARGGTMTFSFAVFRPNPVVYRAPEETPHTISGEEFQAWCTAFGGRAGDVDYVIVRTDRPDRAMCNARQIYADQMRREVIDEDWELYRVLTPLGARQTGCDCPGK